jgi:hypothetical protein
LNCALIGFNCIDDDGRQYQIGDTGCTVMSDVVTRDRAIQPLNIEKNIIGDEDYCIVLETLLGNRSLVELKVDEECDSRTKNRFKKILQETGSLKSCCFQTRLLTLGDTPSSLFSFIRMLLSHAIQSNP